MTNDTTIRTRSIRRVAAVLFGALLASTTVLVSANGAGAQGRSGWGGYGTTYAYCGNAHDLHQFDFKNFVSSDSDNQRVAQRTAFHDDNGWHYYPWQVATASNAFDQITFHTVVGPTRGWHAVVYTQYAWEYWDGWHVTGWDQAVYQTIFGTALSYCAI